MIDLKEYIKLKKEAENLKREVDQSQGALDQLLKRLKKEYDCDTIREGENLLLKLRQEYETLEEEFQEKLLTFQGRLKEIRQKRGDDDY